jgi:ribulose-5-phosphate 4-epimerase/fuculose-1-phosphate aldolase
MFDFIKFNKKMSKFVVGAEGNISWKFNDTNFVIKCSGYKLSEITEESLVICDLNDSLKKFENNKRPSIEVGFHSWLLKNTKFKVIAHTHPTNVMKILCSEKNTNIFSSKRMFPDQVVFNGKKSCVVPYANPGKDLFEQICFQVTKYEQENNEFPRLILLQNHGIICCANSFSEAITITEICDKSAEIFNGVMSMAEFPTFLNEKQILDLENDEREKYRKNI